MSGESLDIFAFIPEPLIHDTGVVVMIVIFLAGFLGLTTMARAVARQTGVSLRALVSRRSGIRRALGAAWRAGVVDGLGQRRYRTGCESHAGVAWYRRRWFLHALVMWGFIGLLAATAIDYGLALAGIKETGTPVPIWYPVRLLGTLAGLALVYGTTAMIVRRLRRADRSVRTSTAADWTFLLLVELTGLTGFALEVGLYLPEPPTWGYWMFLFHVTLAMELVLLAPFMKFAHAIYRPLALFFLSLSAKEA
jgi:nitrate reductase gamma subunit